MTSLIDIDTDSRPAPSDTVEGKITSYLSLKQDWDGYGAGPPTTQAVVDALLWLGRLPADFLPPKPMLSGSGELGLYWDRNGFYCDIGFLGDGTFSYYAQVPEGSSLGDENIDIKKLPAPLLAFLSRIDAD